MIKTAAIDLFCGVGGLSFGLKKAGIKVVAGIDLDESCRFAFEKNIKARFINQNISEMTGNDLVKTYWGKKDVVRILAGCAPCQPFSPHTNKNKERQKSEKWFLLNEFKRLINETLPEIITMENVPNLANQKIFMDFVKFLKNNEYFVTYTNAYCPDYGIPQKRRRLVLLASRLGEISLIPKTHSKEEYLTLYDAIGHLPPINSGEISEHDPLHRTMKLSDINIRRIRASKPNGTWQDWDEDLRLPCHKRRSGKTFKAVYGRMAWEEPASTITTQFYNLGTGRFGHPSQDRAITLREAALIQTFPDFYKFWPEKKQINLKRLGIHIGNAVPVDLGFIIGKSILKHLEGKNNE